MPKTSSNSQTHMPSSPSSAGTPEPEKSQQLRPSAIMESFLTLMGSQRARPRATSWSTPSSEALLRTRMRHACSRGIMVAVESDGPASLGEEARKGGDRRDAVVHGPPQGGRRIDRRGGRGRPQEGRGSAWKENSANFVLTEFSEVRHPQATPK